MSELNKSLEAMESAAVDAMDKLIAHATALLDEQFWMITYSVCADRNRITYNTVLHHGPIIHWDRSIVSLRTPDVTFALINAQKLTEGEYAAGKEKTWARPADKGRSL